MWEMGNKSRKVNIFHNLARGRGLDWLHEWTAWGLMALAASSLDLSPNQLSAFQIRTPLYLIVQRCQKPTWENRGQKLRVRENYIVIEPKVSWQNISVLSGANMRNKSWNLKSCRENKTDPLIGKYMGSVKKVTFKQWYISLFAMKIML